MRSFLEQVAQYYIDNVSKEALHRLTFVFPNRRSGQFFERAMQRLVTGTVILPQVTTLVEWLGDLTGSVPVTPVESIFILYRAYCKVMRDNADDMEHFIYWASIIVNDFNDVDRNMVDARDLFTNVHQVREIRTDYMSDELKEDIRRIFNIDLPTAQAEVERFWRHLDEHKEKLTNKPEDEVAARFYSLWEALADVYDEFHREMERRGVASPGMMFRKAVDTVAQLDANDVAGALPRVVMVGFADLSVSEIEIFKQLRNKRLAHFWWDAASPLLKAVESPWAAMMTQYVQLFAMPAPLDAIGTLPQVKEVSVSGNMSQAKTAFHEVDTMIKDGAIPQDQDAISTAIVLPDESLLVPLINSISPQVKALNVTLGIPLQRSSIVSLMHIVARMHHQAMRRGDGRWMFYRDDVRDLLSHPIIKSLHGSEATRLTTDIAANNMFNVPLSLVENYPGLLPLFRPVEDSQSLEHVLAHIDRLEQFALTVDAAERERLRDDADIDNIDDNAHGTILPLQSAFIRLYVGALRQLRHVLEKNADIFSALAGDTVFFLIDRLTASLTIPFTGEPLKGLQVMGVLETRALDFDNLIVLSMNDRTYPGRRGLSSFIPDYMRADKLMPTMATTEAVNAYYFYRMIARARHVTLIYNASTVRMGANEPSRFIAQLRNVYNITTSHHAMEVAIEPSQPLALAVPKDAHVAERYGAGAAPVDGRKRWLSASAINKYINCPLAFYFHYIQDLNDDNAPSDFMDRADFGTIVHDTLQHLYYPNEKPRRVYAADIDRFIKNDLSRVATREINRVYAHHEPDAPLTGEALLMLDTIEAYVRNVLIYDKELLGDDAGNYIQVIECEVKHRVTLDVDGVQFDFTFKADRIDRLVVDGILGRVRVIDYKTGKDATMFSDMEKLFDGDADERPKAILQLLLYCRALRQLPDLNELIDRNEPFEPVIYKAREMAESGVWWGTKSKRKQYVQGDPEFTAQDAAFEELMGECMDGLFDQDTPWTQCAVGAKHCDYCNYRDFCRR